MKLMMDLVVNHTSDQVRFISIIVVACDVVKTRLAPML